MRVPPHNRNPRTHTGRVTSGGSVLQAPLAYHRTELQPKPPSQRSSWASGEEQPRPGPGNIPRRAGLCLWTAVLLNVSTERNHTHALWCLRLAPLTRHHVFPSHPRPRVSTSFPPVAEQSPRLDRITLVLALQRLLDISVVPMSAAVKSTVDGVRVRVFVQACPFLLGPRLPVDWMGPSVNFWPTLKTLPKWRYPRVCEHPCLTPSAELAVFSLILTAPRH